MCFILVVQAHHGFGGLYDVNQYITIEGVVTKFEYVNPHAFVYIQTSDESGANVIRWCEMQSRTQLSRKGITRTAFNIGDTVTLEGFQ